MNYNLTTSPSAILSFTNDKLYPIAINVTYVSQGTLGGYGEGMLNTNNIFSNEVQNNSMIIV